MNEANRSDLGKLILRVAVGGMMLLHGISKLQNGTGGIGDMLTGAGLPSFLQYGAVVGEVVAPVLLILGILTIPSTLLIAFTMVMAVGLAHSADLLSLGKGGGWAIELQALYFFASISIALIGSGKYSFGKGRLK
jgi:putative oxidoreductase